MAGLTRTPHAARIAGNGATVADVREKITGTGITDESIEAALKLAESLIDLRSHGTFRSLTSQTIHDVRTDSVVLQHPGTITTVKVDGIVVPADAYEVTPWGFRFFSGPVWVDPVRPVVREPFRKSWNSARGVTVTVEGTFGEDPGPLITKAAVLLAVAEIEPSSGQGDIMVPAGVKSYSVEGLSVTFAGEGASGKPSTGSSEADQLIDLRLGQRIFVA